MELLKKRYYGMPIWMIAICLFLIYGAIYLGLLPDQDMLSIITIMFAGGLVLYEIGEHLPIWKDFLGGGAVMAFFGAAVLEHFQILLAKYADAITFYYDDFGFQTVFITLLIVSAVLAVNRKQLVKAFSGYIPAILGGIAAAILFGILGGLICGINLKDIVAYYVLPTMGGLLLAGAVFVVSRVFSKNILPAIGPVSLHMYAYMVVFTAILNIANVIPVEIKEGVKRLSNFFTKPLMCYCMFGIGVAFTDLADFLAVLNWQTLLISAMVVLGAIIGSGTIGMLFEFNFVESAITAGLCMANRGGSGDLQVLGAGKRMNLMSYAQISSRIGGAIILLLGSVIFGFMA